MCFLFDQVSSEAVWAFSVSYFGFLKKNQHEFKIQFSKKKRKSVFFLCDHVVAQTAEDPSTDKEILYEFHAFSMTDETHKH